MVDQSDNMNQGMPTHRGLDELGRREVERRLNPGGPDVVGNLADVQRAGADAVKGIDADSVQLPPGYDADDLNHPAETDAAAGAATRETERTGIEPEPLPEAEPKVDPKNLANARNSDGTSDTADEYEDYTVEELKDKLADRDLPVSGNKQELIDRLNAGA